MKKIGSLVARSSSTMMGYFHRGYCRSFIGIVIIFICGLMIIGCSNEHSIPLSSEENCTCSFQEYQTQLNDLKAHEDNIDDGDGSYPSVIFYHEHLYWYSSENVKRKIPKDYLFIGTAQCILTKGLTLPEKQLESNLKWGSKIYANGKNEYLYVDTDGEISMFINETLLEER